MPEAMTTRASTVEHPFGTIKLWTGSRHFLMKRLKNVRTEMSLNVLAYNLRRMIGIVGVLELVNVLRAIVVSVFSALLRRLKPLRSLLLCSPLLMRIAKGATREQLSTI
ncbi:MAG: transposase [Candidatus Thiodiazotropha sp. 4PDIV1]